MESGLGNQLEREEREDVGEETSEEDEEGNQEHGSRNQLRIHFDEKSKHLETVIGAKQISRQFTNWSDSICANSMFAIVS